MKPNKQHIYDQIKEKGYRKEQEFQIHQRHKKQGRFQNLPTKAQQKAQQNESLNKQKKKFDIIQQPKQQQSQKQSSHIQFYSFNQSDQDEFKNQTNKEFSKDFNTQNPCKSQIKATFKIPINQNKKEQTASLMNKYNNKIDSQSKDQNLSSNAQQNYFQQLQNIQKIQQLETIQKYLKKFQQDRRKCENRQNGPLTFILISFCQNLKKVIHQKKNKSTTNNQNELSTRYLNSLIKPIFDYINKEIVQNILNTIKEINKSQKQKKIKIQSLVKQVKQKVFKKNIEKITYLQTRNQKIQNQYRNSRCKYHKQVDQLKKKLSYLKQRKDSCEWKCHNFEAQVQSNEKVFLNYLKNLTKKQEDQKIEFEKILFNYKKSLKQAQQQEKQLKKSLNQLKEKENKYKIIQGRIQQLANKSFSFCIQLKNLLQNMWVPGTIKKQNLQKQNLNIMEERKPLIYYKNEITKVIQKLESIIDSQVSKINDEKSSQFLKSQSLLYIHNDFIPENQVSIVQQKEDLMRRKKFQVNDKVLDFQDQCESINIQDISEQKKQLNQDFNEYLNKDCNLNQNKQQTSKTNI